MTRFPTHIAAAFAAITITFLTLQPIVTVPASQATLLTAPVLA